MGDDRKDIRHKVISAMSVLGYSALVIAIVTKQNYIAVMSMFLLLQVIVSTYRNLSVSKPELQQSAQNAVRQLEQSLGRHADYDLIVDYPDNKVVQIVRALNEVYYLEIDESNRLANYNPVWFQKKKISNAEAEYVKSRLEAAGAVVRIISRR